MQIRSNLIDQNLTEKRHSRSVHKPHSYFFGSKHIASETSSNGKTGYSSTYKRPPSVDWNKLNPIQRELYGLGSLLIAGSMLFFTLCFPRPELGSTLAFERCNRNHIQLEYERFLAGKKESRKEEQTKAWGTAGMSLGSIFWSYFGSKALYTATVHLDPTYEPQSEPPGKAEKSRFQELKESTEKVGFFGNIAKVLMLGHIYFSEKYDLESESHYIPSPPPKLSLLDRFFLKYYFKTKPSWEYTEEERQKIAASYRK
jgi:hypothetical protein